MNNQKLGSIVTAAMLTASLSLAGGLAFAGDGDHKKPAAGQQMSPHLAAKREMVRKQQAQRVTPEKRKAAAEALKAERLKVYNAKQAVKKSQPAALDNK